MADLPGLIEGAAANRGLGHAFLKHTEKAKALALVVSNKYVKTDLKNVYACHGLARRNWG